MIAKNTSVIALVGVSAHELRVLQTICVISKDRPQIYVLQDEIQSATADIAIVDQDNSKAMAAWQRFQTSNPAIPVIMLTRQPKPDPSGYQLGRPLMATRLLNLLDKIQQTLGSPAFAPPQTDGTKESTRTPEPQAAQQSAVGKDEKGSRLTALVVDDSLPVRRQIGLHLTPLVGRVDLAEDGERAVEFIAHRSYDIIFLDVVLPGMDGYKICREIKRNKRTKMTPVIMLTGKSSPFDRVKGKLAGCDTYLTKPVDDTTFDEVVQKYLKKRRASESGEGRGKLSDSVPEHA
ncbi:MAG: response regulator [Pseudomonadota bacterium]